MMTNLITQSPVQLWSTFPTFSLDICFWFLAGQSDDVLRVIPSWADFATVTILLLQQQKAFEKSYKSNSSSACNL